MVSSLVQSWLDHVASRPESTYWFRKVLLAPCPRRAVRDVELGTTPLSPSERLVDRAHATFLRQIRQAAVDSIPGFLPHPGLLLDHLQVSLLGVHGDHCLCLLVGEPGEDPETLSVLWSVRWELASIAQITGKNSFILLLVGAQSQLKPKCIRGTLEPRTEALEMLVEVPAIRGPQCVKCTYRSECPEQDRQGGPALGVPPVFQKCGEPRSGKALLNRSATLLDRITQHLVGHSEAKSGYSPSLIGRELEEEHPCLRVPYFAGLGTPREQNQSLAWVFQMGHAWHEALQNVALEVDPTVEIEAQVRSGNLRGRLDFRSGDLIVDLKTVSDHSGTPKGSVGQVHCYALASMDSGHPIRRGAVLSFLKGVGTHKVKEFPLDEKLLDKIRVVIRTTDLALEREQVPPRYEGAEPRSWRCRDCAFTTHCWSTP